MPLDLIDRTIQSKALLVAGLVVACVFLVYIAITHAPAEEPCDLEARWELACYRYEAAGWPPCDEVLADVSVVELTPAMVASDRDAHGAWDEDSRTVAVAEDHCGALDPAMEHEQSHARGLLHGGPSGSVTASPASRAGLAIPAYGGSR